MSWRDQIRVHPAADLFPMMSDAELDELAADVAKNGLWEFPVWLREGDECVLLDGRNRIAAIDRITDRVVRDRLWRAAVESKSTIEADPYAYVVSANIRRRHLTAEQRRELIAKLLKENPERSDRATAKISTVYHMTVAAVRAESERRGEIPHATARTDTRGRSQPVRKARNQDPPIQAPSVPVAMLSEPEDQPLPLAFPAAPEDPRAPEFAPAFRAIEALITEFEKHWDSVSYSGGFYSVSSTEGQSTKTWFETAALEAPVTAKFTAKSLKTAAAGLTRLAAERERIEQAVKKMRRGLSSQTRPKT